MINYQDFINKEVINKNNEIGLVTSFDKEHIIVNYSLIEKKYSSSVVFKTGFLSFKDKELQNLINQDLLEKNIVKEKKEETIKKCNNKHLSRIKKANETYKRLSEKNKMLMSLFGRDFIYPPLKEFEKKYKLLINKRHHYSSVLTDYYY